MPFLTALLWIVESALAVLVGYLLLLTLLSLFAPRRTPLPDRPRTRFAILVPAHNEELLLPGLLRSLADLDYPAALYTVHVVADNCTDSTAGIARQAGVHVYERFNTELVGKGYALNWLLEQITGATPNTPYDAFIIFDADTLVSANFLRVTDARLQQGADAVQGYYAVRDPAASWGAAVRYAALAVLHYLRPLGRGLLGGSPGLKGNGMAFTAAVLERFPWSASLTEDIEYHMALILDGRRVVFAPDAVVWAEMPGTLRGSQTQNVRWERGRVQMVRQYVPRLLKEGLRRRSFALIDTALEQVIPPFAVLVGATVLPLLAALALGVWPVFWLGLALLAAQAVYTLTGLLLVRAPFQVYLALLGAPFYVLWKLWLYARVLLGLDRQGWVRTARQ